MRGVITNHDSASLSMTYFLKKKIIKPLLNLLGSAKYNIELFNLVYTKLVFHEYRAILDIIRTVQKWLKTTLGFCLPVNILDVFIVQVNPYKEWFITFMKDLENISQR